MRTKKEQKNVNRRILYLWLPNIALDRLRRTKIELDAKNLSSIAAVIVQTEYGRRTVVATCSISKRLGIIVGWSLDDDMIKEIDLLNINKTVLNTRNTMIAQHLPKKVIFLSRKLPILRRL